MGGCICPQWCPTHLPALGYVGGDDGQAAEPRGRGRLGHHALVFVLDVRVVRLAASDMRCLVFYGGGVACRARAHVLDNAWARGSVVLAVQTAHPLRSSTMTTRSPRASSASVTCDPTKPSPPVTCGFDENENVDRSTAAERRRRAGESSSLHHPRPPPPAGNLPARCGRRDTTPDTAPPASLPAARPPQQGAPASRVGSLPAGLGAHRPGRSCWSGRPRASAAPGAPRRAAAAQPPPARNATNAARAAPFAREASKMNA